MYNNMESYNKRHLMDGPYSYLIFRIQDHILAKNGLTGKIDYSGTDATTVIQNAINVSNGGKIFIKEGIYVSPNIDIKSDITIEGDGMNKTIFLTYSSSILTSNGNVRSNNGNINIKDCQFRSTSISTSKLVDIKYSNDVHVSNCKFDGGYDAGLSLNECERSSITNCIATNGGHQAAGGGIVTNAFGGIISQNVAYSNKSVGIGISQSGIANKNWECIISNNICHNNGVGNSTYPGHGIRVYLSNRVIVIGNQCYENDQYGILSYKSKNTLITGNHTYKNFRNGIVSHGENNNIEESDLITCNISTGNTLYGIGLWNAQKNYVTNNTVANNGSGIVEAEDSSGLTDNNVIKYNDLRYQISDKIIKIGKNSIVSQNLGYITENSGTITTSGTGNQATFMIPHNLVSTPTVVQLDAKSEDAAGAKYWTADNVNIIVTYLSAPLSDTNNVILSWNAKV